MKRIFILLTVFAVLLCLSPPTQAAMTYGLSHYTNNLGYVGSGGTNDPLYNIINEIESSLISSAGATSILFTPGTAPTGVEGTVYYDSASNGLLVHTGSAFVTIDTAGASSLDTAYNTGATIDVDGDPVSLTTSATDNNRVLDVTQNDTTNNPAAVLITNSGTGAGLTFATTGTNDATGTSTLWALSAAGTVTGTALSAGNGDLTFTEPTTNDVYLLADADAQLTIGGTSKEDIDLNLATADTLTVTSSTGLVKVNWGNVDAHSGLNALVFDGAVANTITQTGTGSGDDLTIAQSASAQDASLILTSSGTGTDAFKVATTAGGIDIDGETSTLTITNTSNGDGDDLTIEVDGDDDASIILTSDGTGGDAISLITSAATGDIKINSGDLIDIDAVDTINVDISGAAKDFDVDSAAGSISLDGGEAAADAVVIIASATAGGMDVDAGTGGIAVDTTGAFSVDGAAASNISVVSGSTDENLTLSVTGATASSVIVSSAGTGDDALDLNATAGGVDVDSVKSIVLTTTENTADSIVLQSTVGGIDILCDAASATEDIDIANTGGSVNINSSEAADLAVYISTSNAAGQIAISSADTTTDSIEIDTLGGVDLAAADDVALVLTTSTDAEDFTIQVDGDDNCSIILSDGSDADAIKINASHATTGGIDIDAGSNGINIKATGGDVKLENTTAKDIILDATAGRVLVTGTESAANAIHLYADGANGEIYLQAKAGGVDIDVASGDITLDNTGAATDEIMLNNATGTAASAATEHDAAIQLHASAGGIGLLSALNGDDSIRIETNGGDDENITIRSNQGTGQDSIYLLSDEGGIDIVTSTHTGASATTESDAAIQLEALLGGIGLYSTLNADDAIRIETNGGDDENITIRSHQGTGQDSIYLLSDEGGVELAATAHTGASAATEHDAAIQLHASAGGIGILSALDSDDSIRIETNGGDNENITIRSNQGTGADSIYLLSDEGGIELEATGNTATTAIVMDATAGGITMGAADDITITLASTGTTEDLSILLTGNQTSSILIDSEGSDVDALSLTTSTNGGDIVINSNDVINIDSAGDTDILVTASTANEDLNLGTAGDQDSHVTITADGSSVNAFTVLADAGGIDMDAATDKIHIQNAADGADDDITIAMTGAHDASIILDNTQGTGTDAISLQATAGSVDIDAVATGDVTVNGGQILIASEHNTADAIRLLANTGASETITITNTNGTGTAALGLTATAGGIDITAAAGKIIDIDGGTIQIDSATEGAGAIALTTNQGATDTITVTNTQGTDPAAIALTATAGSVTLTTGLASSGVLVNTSTYEHKIKYFPISQGVVAASEVIVGGGTGLICTSLDAGVNEAGATEGYVTVGDNEDILIFSIPLPDDFVDTGTQADFNIEFDIDEQATEECNMDVRIFEYDAVANATAIITDTIVAANNGTRAWKTLVTNSTGIGNEADLAAGDHLIIEITATADTDDFDIYGIRLTYRVGLQATN